MPQLLQNDNGDARQPVNPPALNPTIGNPSGQSLLNRVLAAAQTQAATQQLNDVASSPNADTTSEQAAINRILRRSDNQ